MAITVSLVTASASEKRGAPLAGTHWRLPRPTWFWLCGRSRVPDWTCQRLTFQSLVPLFWGMLPRTTATAPLGVTSRSSGIAPIVPSATNVLVCDRVSPESRISRAPIAASREPRAASREPRGRTGVFGSSCSLNLHPTAASGKPPRGPFPGAAAGSGTGAYRTAHSPYPGDARSLRRKSRARSRIPPTPLRRPPARPPGFELRPRADTPAHAHRARPLIRQVLGPDQEGHRVGELPLAGGVAQPALDVAFRSVPGTVLDGYARKA